MAVDKIIDASALAAVAFVEAEAPDVIEQIQGARLLSPGLLTFELANIAWKKARRHPDMAGHIRESLADALSTPVLLAPVDPLGVLQLAIDRSLSAYDASYLWLALELGVPLVSLDRALVKASQPAED